MVASPHESHVEGAEGAEGSVEVFVAAEELVALVVWILSEAEGTE